MTDAELISFVQAHFNDQTSQFRSRVVKTVPIGIGMFASEHQWEFLDKFTTTTAETDSTASKDKITLPADFWKPIRFYTSNRVVSYIDRAAWSKKQRASLPSGEPRAYTVIGPDYFLDRASDGSTISVVYTRRSSGMSLSDVPAEFHDAVGAAVIWRLTPGFVQMPEGPVPNPAYGHAEDLYGGRVRVALSSENSIKGRTQKWTPTYMTARRSDYR